MRNKLLELINSVNMLLIGAGWIGWDVAVTPQGCEMVEGNYLVNCNFLQTWDKKGKYSFIKNYL